MAVTVKQYLGRDAFEAGINKQQGLGWLLKDWKIVLIKEVIHIIAIFVGR